MADPAQPREPPGGGPTITVIVATRNRPLQLRTCVESILRNDHASFEVLVVEQSVEPAELPDDPRLRRIRSATSGKSAGLNVGLCAVLTPIIAFTDDDCIVPVDWLRRGQAVLDDHPEISLVFGDLVPIEHDVNKVFVPSATFETFRVVTSRRSAATRGGAGADMFARRSLFEVIGGYDEIIGPGTRFHACEEFDIYYRALAAGRQVAFTPEISVIHDGGRTYADGAGRLLLRRYALGEGAVIAKHLRLRDLGMVLPAVQILAGDLREIARNVAHRHLTGIGVLAYKWRGFFMGLATPVDRKLHLYRPRHVREQ